MIEDIDLQIEELNKIQGKHNKSEKNEYALSESQPIEMIKK